MRKPASIIFGITASLLAAEPAVAQRHALAITSSRVSEKIVLKVDPMPTGKVDVHVTVIDPGGIRSPLPPLRTTADPSTGNIIGPAIPSETRGFFVEVELRDAVTGKKLGLTGTWVT